ncbi:hypothetical protein TNCV_93321 [Trichonephila clavipes]|nr:hypothetical protein TNCV_93321 [Trichonephila clavipes]
MTTQGSTEHSLKTTPVGYEERPSDKRGRTSKRFTVKSSVEVQSAPRAESVPEPDEIGNLIEEVVHLAKQINLEVDSEEIQELLDSHNQEQTIHIRS